MSASVRANWEGRMAQTWLLAAVWVGLALFATRWILGSVSERG